MLKEYELVITENARQWIKNYIAGSDAEYEDIETVNIIFKKISSLQTLPYRIKLVDNDSYKSVGLRKIQAGKYYIYFIVGEDKDCVYIVAFEHIRGLQRINLENISSSIE